MVEQSLKFPVSPVLIAADRPAESVVDILPDSVDFANGFDVVNGHLSGL